MTRHLQTKHSGSIYRAETAPSHGRCCAPPSGWQYQAWPQALRWCENETVPQGIHRLLRGPQRRDGRQPPGRIRLFGSLHRSLNWTPRELYGKALRRPRGVNPGHFFRGEAWASSMGFGATVAPPNSIGRRSRCATGRRVSEKIHTDFSNLKLVE